MNIDPSIFRAYDIRGIVATALTPTAVTHIGKALGSRIQRDNPHKTNNKIAVGRDGRLSSATLSAALIEGLTSTGCQVVDIGEAPTPLSYYAAKKISDGNCVAITGSHNPPEYNGLKMVLNHQTLATTQITSLIDEIQQENYHIASGSCQTIDISEQYLTEITTSLPLKRPLKVIVDAGNGVAGELAPKLIRQMGCEVIEMYCEIDGNFPNHHPDPSKPENLLELQQAVIEQQADIGIAYDGDGDRIGVVDTDGNNINADRLLMLYAQNILENQPGAEILFDVKCSSHLPKWIEKYQGKATMCRTGHSFVKKKLAETNAALAGEMSGHIFFNDIWYGFDDALYSTARLLKILTEITLTSADLFAKLPNSINTPEINIPFNEGENFAVMEKIIQSANQSSNFTDAKISTIDGIRVDFADGWGLVRPSNTTPVLVLRFEADTTSALERIKNDFKNMIRQHTDHSIDF